MREAISIYTQAEGTDAVNARINDALEYITSELNHDYPHSRIREAKRLHHQEGHTVSKHINHSADLRICIDLPGDDRCDDAHQSPRNHAAKHAIPGGHIILVRAEDVGQGIESLIKHDVTIHIIDAGIRLTATKTGGASPAAKRAIEAIEGRHDSTITDEPLTGHVHTGGRPPLGCKVEDGMYRADDDYSKVRQTLFRVENDEMSRADAARRLECVEKTVDNALGRRELYQLDAIEPIGP